MTTKSPARGNRLDTVDRDRGAENPDEKGTPVGDHLLRRVATDDDLVILDGPGELASAELFLGHLGSHVRGRPSSRARERTVAARSPLDPSRPDRPHSRRSREQHTSSRKRPRKNVDSRSKPSLVKPSFSTNPRDASFRGSIRTSMRFNSM